MILAIHQPQFCPWLGYFDKMRRADLFVLLDDVQFEKNNWQNRNRIKTQNGSAWFTVPVSYRFGQEIREVGVNNALEWQKRYEATLMQSYARAKGLARAVGFMTSLFRRRWDSLLDLNLFSIRWLADRLRIPTPTRLSSEWGVKGQSTQRLVNLCRLFGADVYLAGAGGRKYMDMGLFERAGIRVEFQQFAHPRYCQLHGGFVPGLSALDWVLNTDDEGAPLVFQQSLKGNGEPALA